MSRARLPDFPRRFSVHPQFIKDASELIDFFQTHNLRGCLPRGTATFWPLNDPGKNTTIDQTVTNQPELLVKCHLYHENYGSDRCTPNGKIQSEDIPRIEMWAQRTEPIHLTGKRSEQLQGQVVMGGRQ
jgi:hypothetical protein